MSQSEKERRAALLTAVPERKSGRAVFDEGRTVWEWQTATGVFERHVSDEQLSRLEASDLRLVEQPAAKDAGRAIYSSGAVAGNSTPRARTPTPRSNGGAFRQFWRRLVPAG
jgi:hypothetical protein